MDERKSETKEKKKKQKARNIKNLAEGRYKGEFERAAGQRLETRLQNEKQTKVHLYLFATTQQQCSDKVAVMPPSLGAARLRREAQRYKTWTD